MSAAVQSLPRPRHSHADGRCHRHPSCFPRECSSCASTHSFCAVQCRRQLLLVGGIRWKCEHRRRWTMPTGDRQTSNTTVLRARYGLRASKKQARRARALFREVIDGWEVRHYAISSPRCATSANSTSSHCPLVMGMWEFDHELSVCIPLLVHARGTKLPKRSHGPRLDPAVYDQYRDGKQSTQPVGVQDT